jgi:hypothetical protein
MNKKLILSFVVLFCLLAFPLQASGLAAPQSQGGDVATLNVTPNGLAWQPLVNAAGWSLHIAGPDGKFYEQNFAAGTQPIFSIKDLPDGLYTYELWGTPLNAAAAVAVERAVEKAGEENQPSAKAFYMSGTFTVKDGAAFLPDPLAVERPQSPAGPTAPEDWVLADDMIVQGNACIGPGCANGEVFQNEPFKLKWDWMHIYFQDNSIMPGYPSNDWAIDVNDDASGGTNYFAIRDVTGAHTPFKIMAGAPANAMYVAASGDVSMGSATPYGEFNVVDDYEPSVILEQTAPAQMWGISGTETQFFLYDYTHSKKPFMVEVNAPTDSLHIEDTGDVTIAGFLNERSDVAAKTDFVKVNGQDVLDRLSSVPITTWSYKDSPDVRHMGPMAQDFRAAYGLGPDDKHLAALDTNGVALAAIQELDAQNKELKARLQALEARQGSTLWSQLAPLAFGLLGVLAGMAISRRKKG